MKDRAGLNNSYIYKSSNILIDEIDREFLIKLMQFNHSVYRNKGKLPEDIAKKYGYEILHDRKDSRTGYYAVAFKKSDADEIIIAHRGALMNNITKVFEGDWSFKRLKNLLYELSTGIQDGIKLSFNKVPKQAFQAISFVNYIVSRYKNHKILQTGHSLGGYLSQVVYWSCDIETHAFECPGAHYSLKKLFPDSEPIRDNLIKYYFTYPPCGISCDGLRLYPSEKFVYEIVLNSSLCDKTFNPNMISLSVVKFITSSFYQHVPQNIIDSLSTRCILRRSKGYWPSNPLDSYKRHLSVKNEAYWREQFENLNLPQDIRWQIFKYFKEKYLKPRKSLTYFSSLFIRNITTQKLVKDFERHQHITRGGSWMSYQIKEVYFLSYLYKIYCELKNLIFKKFLS